MREEEASVDELTLAPKVVFSSSLEEPLDWANSTLVRRDAAEAVRAMNADGAVERVRSQMLAAAARASAGSSPRIAAPAAAKSATASRSVLLQPSGVARAHALAVGARRSRFSAGQPSMGEGHESS